jgi:hypothetical protein
MVSGFLWQRYTVGIAVTFITYSSYPKLLTQLGRSLLIHIHLPQNPTASRIGLLLDYGFELLAGTAPGGPEIEDDELGLVEEGGQLLQGVDVADVGFALLLRRLLRRLLLLLLLLTGTSELLGFLGELL